MAAYERAFRNRGRTIGQVLLTRDDFAVRTRYLNARRTFSTLFSHGVVPIINENDTVAIDEIKLGDNDNLSAFVAQLVGAELLILLSDVDGLYSDDPSRNPHATLIPIVEKVTPGIERLGRQSGSDRGTGGMITKLQAARTCSTAGIAMIIANGSRAHNLEEIVSGTFRGTLFLPAHSRLNVRKHWIGFVAHTRGEIVLDDGAVSAILHRHSSLLPGGITECGGRFSGETHVPAGCSGTGDRARHRDRVVTGSGEGQRNEDCRDARGARRSDTVRSSTKTIWQSWRRMHECRACIGPGTRCPCGRRGIVTNHDGDAQPAPARDRVFTP